MAANDFIWDSNQTNMDEPTQALFDDGYAESAVPTSANMNYVLHYLSTNRIPVGTRLFYAGNIAGITTPGYLPCVGETIAKSNSAATYTSDNYKELFVFLWTNDSASVVSPSKGASALDDWNDDKTITLPNGGGKVLVGKSSVAGSAFNVDFGQSVGVETVTLTESQVPEVTPVVTDPGHVHTRTWDEVGFKRSGEADSIASATFEVADHTYPVTSDSATTGITIAPFGGGQPHTNIQPSSVGNYIIKW